MKNECNSHNSTVLAICVPKISHFDAVLMKFWQKQVWTFLDHPVLNLYIFGLSTALIL